MNSETLPSQPSQTSLLELVRSNPNLRAALQPRLTRYIPHTPTPKQAAFLLLPHREAFYGGSAGGGKSDALLMGALQYVDVPHYAAILFRRTYADLSLPGALMDRAQEWLAGTDARWQDKTKTWLFPSGATISFGYLENETDKFRYQSAEFQYVAFDELTHFAESQYRYLFSRLRRLADSTVPLRMRSASNPGGVGHEWVKQRFLVEGRENGRVFIPARVEDNPFIDQDEYVENLKRLNPLEYEQLRNGDWDALPDGEIFKREWFGIVPAAPPSTRWVRFWDLAATEAKLGTRGKQKTDPDWTAGALVGRDPEGIYYIGDMQRFRKTPGSVKTHIRQTAESDGLNVEIAMEQEPGSGGVFVAEEFRRKVLEGFAFTAIRSTGDKVTRAIPLSTRAQHGEVRLVRGPWISSFLDEAVSFPGGAHDDQVDAAAGAYQRIAQANRYEYLLSDVDDDDDAGADAYSDADPLQDSA